MDAALASLDTGKRGNSIFSFSSFKLKNQHVVFVFMFWGLERILPVGCSFGTEVRWKPLLKTSIYATRTDVLL